MRVGAVDNNAAAMLVLQGRGAEALPLAKNAVDIATASRGPEYRDTLGAQGTCAAALTIAGDLDGAAAYYKEHLGVWPKAMPLDSPVLGDALCE